MKEQILEIIKNKGPTTPSELTRQLKINTMFVGAYLSELVSSKKLFISKLKVGSSPLYYAEGQQEKLQDFYNTLNEKDKEAFDLLKKERVVRDREQTPILRVALRNIPDFSIQLNIKTADGDKEIFWKWYMLTDKEAEEPIQILLGKEIKEKEAVKEKKIIKEQKPTEQLIKEIKPKKEENEEKDKIIEELKKQIEQEKELSKKDKIIEELKKQDNDKKEKLKKDEKDKIIEELKKQIEQEKELLKKEKEKIEEEKKKQDNSQKEKPKEKQKKLKKEETPLEDLLLTKIKEYCKQKNMEILEFEIVKKKTEIDIILKVPSAVGSSKYYCKVKDKKKISEGDLSSAIIKAQTKKLPAIFLSTGELATKAKKELENELKNQIIFQQL